MMRTPFQTRILKNEESSNFGQKSDSHPNIEVITFKLVSRTYLTICLLIMERFSLIGGFIG